MIKLLDILRENKILVPRRSPEERQKNYQIALQKKIQQYIKDGGKGDLDLENTPIQSLPDGLEVGGALYLMNTPIQSLPDGLEVGGILDLDDTSIQSLPPNLKVGGSLYLRDTPISKKYTEEEVRKMVPGVKGDIYLDILFENKILVPRRSPEERQKNYQIALQKKIQQYIKDGGKGDLDLRNTPIQSLPPGLKVGGNLYLDNTPIQSLPDDLKVGGSLDLEDTPISKKYTKEEIRKMVPGVKGDIYL